MQNLEAQTQNIEAETQNLEACTENVVNITAKHCLCVHDNFFSYEGDGLLAQHILLTGRVSPLQAARRWSDSTPNSGWVSHFDNEIRGVRSKS